MRALSTLCKSLLIGFTSSTVKSTHSLLISARLKMGGHLTQLRDVFSGRRLSKVSELAE
jgi:hypothetical protein